MARFAVRRDTMHGSPRLSHAMHASARRCSRSYWNVRRTEEATPLRAASTSWSSVLSTSRQNSRLHILLSLQRAMACAASMSAVCRRSDARYAQT